MYDEFRTTFRRFYRLKLINMSMDTFVQWIFYYSNKVVPVQINLIFEVSYSDCWVISVFRSFNRFIDYSFRGAYVLWIKSYDVILFSRCKVFSYIKCFRKTYFTLSVKFFWRTYDISVTIIYAFRVKCSRNNKLQRDQESSQLEKYIFHILSTSKSNKIYFSTIVLCQVKYCPRILHLS